METAAALAVAWFNDGADSVQELYRTMSLPVGTHSQAAGCCRCTAHSRCGAQGWQGGKRGPEKEAKGEKRCEDEEREAGVTSEAGSFD